MMMRKKSLLWQYLPTYNTNYRLLCVHACTYLPSFLAAGSTTQLISQNFLQNYLNLTWSCSFKVISSDVLFINSVVLSLIFFFLMEKKILIQKGVRDQVLYHYNKGLFTPLPPPREKNRNTKWSHNFFPFNFLKRNTFIYISSKIWTPTSQGKSKNQEKFLGIISCRPSFLKTILPLKINGCKTLQNPLNRCINMKCVKWCRSIWEN